MYFFNIVRHHIIFIFNTKRPISSFFFGEVLQKSLKVWVKCDYFEALHIEMHVHTANLNIAYPTCIQKCGILHHSSPNDIQKKVHYQSNTSLCLLCPTCSPTRVPDAQIRYCFPPSWSEHPSTGFACLGCSVQDWSLQCPSMPPPSHICALFFLSRVHFERILWNVAHPLWDV